MRRAFLTLCREAGWYPSEAAHRLSARELWELLALWRLEREEADGTADGDGALRRTLSERAHALRTAAHSEAQAKRRHGWQRSAAF